ncbi:MAG TPA: DUF72 domain-containing protein [Polyangia bacterium]|nr:DUF72 domain-containing protein [Polyangia bacterium]
MRVYIGTSGYSYKEWKGSFYPEDLSAAKMLSYYAARFPTVEANNTFYKMPTPKVLGDWAAQVPEHFVFGVKAPQRITHQQRLKDAGESLTRLMAATEALGTKLGPFLFQLPPFMKKDLPRLTEFLPTLPAGCAAAFEFRHPSWFADDVYEALRARGAALVMSESEKVTAPLVATADWGYLRLRREDYVDADITAWADKLRAQPWERAFVYFKHEDAGVGPKLAAKLRALVGASAV